MTLTAEDARARLEDAGRTLIGVPSIAIISAAQRASWPAPVRDSIDALGADRRFRGLVTLTRSDVDRMAEALTWLHHVRQMGAQRALFLRSLQNPVTRAPLWPWRDIGVALGCSDRCIRLWCDKALEQIVAALGLVQLPKR